MIHGCYPSIFQDEGSPPRVTWRTCGRCMRDVCKDPEAHDLTLIISDGSSGSMLKLEPRAGDLSRRDALYDYSRAIKINLSSASVSGRQGQTADVAEMSRAHLGVHAASDLA